MFTSFVFIQDYIIIPINIGGRSQPMKVKHKIRVD